MRRAGRRFATPLLAALIVVETTDLLFALDSIPAVFAVTTDTFLVFTSNAFAVLGLRALYFLFAGTIGRFAYLKIGLAAVLVFVGVKMLFTDLYHIPIWASLTVIAALIGGSVVASLRHAGAPASSATERRDRGADLVDHGRGDGGEGNGQEGPQETGHSSPRRQGEDDPQRVESQDPPHNQRLENLGIGLVHGRNQDGDE